MNVLGKTHHVHQQTQTLSRSHVHMLRVCCSSAERPDPTLPSKSVVVKPTLISKTVAPAPQLAPIEHTSTYLLAERQALNDGDNNKNTKRGLAGYPDEPFTGSAVEWMLKKADESLDDLEENPPAIAKALYKVSTGPVGEATSKGVQTAAKVTFEVGKGAIKAAAPVGKWVLQQGAKAAFAAVKKAIAADDKQKKS